LNRSIAAAGGILVLAWWLPGAGAAAHARPHAEVWTRYANARFGFAIDYPAGTFVPERAPDNGDGRRFKAIHGGARFMVWAGYNPLKETPRKFVEETSQTCHSDRAAYAVTGKSWAVVSCERHGEVLYAKRQFVGDRMTSFQMTYPTRERRRWDAALARMAESLKPARR
jgi:hypothetical protein